MEDAAETEPTEARLAALELEMRTGKGRLDAFNQELKLLLVEVNIVQDWIQSKFGVELIDKTSNLFQHIHELEEIEELTDTLSLLNKGGGKLRDRKAKLKARLRRRQPAYDSENDEDVEDHEENEPNEILPDFFQAPECVLDTDCEEGTSVGTPKIIKIEGNAKTRRKRGRKKKEESVKDVKMKLKRKLTSAGELEPMEDGQVENDDEEGGDAEDGEEEDGEKQKKKYVWKPATQEMQCEECGKILKGDSSLRCHMLMHADLRPHQCQEPGCGKRFRNKTKLGQHIKIHGSEKSEICNFCGRGFLRKKDLVIHERTHTGEKPFACPHCPKSFNIKEHLTIHKRVHTGERPYTCEVCNKAFSQANSLRIHKKIHLKQANEAGPSVRKPRGPRKTKASLASMSASTTAHEGHWLAPKTEDPVDVTTSSSMSNQPARDEHTQSPSLQPTAPTTSTHHGKHDLGSGSTRGHEEQQQSQTHQSIHVPHMTTEQQHSLLVQSFFQQAQSLDPVQQNWSFGGNAAGQEDRGGTSHSPHPQPHNLALHHPHGHSAGFKIQHFYQPPQQQQNLSVARNSQPPHHLQTGPFSIPQFHDPSFRHFPH